MLHLQYIPEIQPTKKIIRHIEIAIEEYVNDTLAKQDEIQQIEIDKKEILKQIQQLNKAISDIKVVNSIKV